MTIQFFRPPNPKATPNLSPFCVKAELMLTHADLPFDIIEKGDPTLGPKGKVPYISDDADPLGDSYFIEKHLKSAYGVDFYEGLSPLEVSTAKLVQSAVEEKLYWVLVYSRWQVEANWPIMEEIFFGHMPQTVRSEVAPLARKMTLAGLQGQGMGRHTTEEVYGIGAEIIDQLAVMLGDNHHFVGGKFTSLDASAYGMLINFIQNPVPTPLAAHIENHTNLSLFLNTASQAHFSDAPEIVLSAEQIAV